MSFFSGFYSKLSTNKRKIISNVYWAVLGKVVNIFSSLLVGILIARYLGPEKYGLMNYVISFVTLFNVLSNFGFDNIEIRELAKGSFIIEKLLGTAFALRLILTFITCLIITVVTLIFETDKSTIGLIIIYSSSLIFGSFNIIRNYFTSIVQNEFIVKSEILRTVLGGIIKVVLVILGLPLEWFIIAIAFDFFIIALGYLMAYTNKVGSIKDWSFDRSIAYFQIRESLPLLFSGTAILIYQKIDQLMIRNMLDNEAVGQYAVGAKFAEFIIFIPMMISQTLTPILVQYKITDSEEYKIKRQQFLDVIFWSTFIFCFFLSLFSQPIILTMYGDNYADAIPALQIMAWKAVFSAMFSSSGQLMVVEGIQRLSVFRNIIGCVFNVLLNILIIPLYGINGSAVISILTLCITGYLAHLFIIPYRFLFTLQTRSIFSGLFRMRNMLNLTLKNIKNA